MQSAEFARVLSQANSVDVCVRYLDRRPAGAYYRLHAEKKVEFLGKVKRLSQASWGREFASAYFVDVYLKDESGNVFGFVHVQPSEKMETDTQLKSIMEAASAREPIGSVESLGESKLWTYWRKCVK
jgi:hypothetical protein